MKKIILALALSSLSFASEVEWGHGSMELSGGFLGLKSSISDSINTYSLLQKHKNILGSNFFYAYKLTIFDSNSIKQAQSTYNSAIKMANSIFKLPNIDSKYTTIPEIKHRFKGADLGLTLGYDFLHKGERDYIGIGGYAGVSLPYINSSSSRTTKYLKDAFKASKTELSTYKLGVGIYAQKSLNNFVSIYTSAIYAYQNGNIKNSYAHLDSNIDGTYLELNAGLKFQALKSDYNLGAISISPRLYGTLGWRYREWSVNKVSVNLSGFSNFNIPTSDMKFSSNTMAIGLGYSF